MADENNRIQDMLEPPNDIGNKELLKDSYSKSSLMCSHEESNLDHNFRKVVFYPLNYRSNLNKLARK